MAKNNRNNTKKTNSKPETRQIKQIEISEDNVEKEVDVTTQADSKSEEKVDVEIEESKEASENKEHSEHKEHGEYGDDFLPIHEAKAKKKRVFRMCAVIAALVFSMFFAGSVGAGLALWDEGKSVSDLRYAMFASTVSAKTIDEAEYNEADSSEVVESAVEEVADVEENQESTSKEATSEEAVTDDTKEAVMANVEAGVASTELSTVGAIVKAGTEDELVNIPTNVPVVPYVDPNANYPLSFTTVDESYFTDALFIGDSRLQGFGMWSGLPATFYCATGFQLYKIDTTDVVQTAEGKVPIFDALPYDAFTKIYIKVGLNEMGWATEGKFEELYADVIARLREKEPRAIIYIHGVLPVTAEKSATDGSHNNVNISNRNAALADFAITQKAYFINAGTALAGLDGALPAEMTNDGIHLKSQYMSIWKQYLMEHAIVVR